MSSRRIIYRWRTSQRRTFQQNMFLKRPPFGPSFFNLKLSWLFPLPWYRVLQNMINYRQLACTLTVFLFNYEYPRRIFLKWVTLWEVLKWCICTYVSLRPASDTYSPISFGAVSLRILRRILSVARGIQTSYFHSVMFVLCLRETFMAMPELHDASEINRETPSKR